MLVSLSRMNSSRANQARINDTQWAAIHALQSYFRLNKKIPKELMMI